MTRSPSTTIPKDPLNASGGRIVRGAFKPVAVDYLFIRHAVSRAVRVGSRRQLQGYLAILAAALFFGAWASAGTIALRDLHPLTIVFYTQFLPGLAFLPWIRGTRLTRMDAKLVAATTLVGAVAGPLAYFYGLERTTPANAALLSNSESFFTMILAFLLLRERLTRRGYPALVVIALGAFLVTTNLRFGDAEFFGHLLGNTLLLAAAFFWALNNIGSTVLLRRMRILPLLAMQLLFGSVLVLPAIAGSGVSLEVPLAVLPYLVFLAMAGIGVFAVLFFYAFRTIGAMRAGAVLTTSSLWGVLIALSLFPEEGLDIWETVGGALMIGGLIAMYMLGERGAAPSPTAGEGEMLKPAASDGPESP